MEEIRQVDGQLVSKLILMDDDISNAGMYFISIFSVKYNLFGSDRSSKGLESWSPEYLKDNNLSRNYSVIREPQSGAARRRELRPLLNCFNQDDPDLIEMVRGFVLLWSILK